MTNERELADHTYGKPGWSAGVDRSLREIKDAVKNFTDKQTKWFQDDQRWKRKIENRIEDLEGAPRNGNEEEEEEITGVQSVDELRRRARNYRARSNKMKRTARWGIPALVTALVTLIEVIIQIARSAGK